MNKETIFVIGGLTIGAGIVAYLYSEETSPVIPLPLHKKGRGLLPVNIPEKHPEEPVIPIHKPKKPKPSPPLPIKPTHPPQPVEPLDPLHPRPVPNATFKQCVSTYDSDKAHHQPRIRTTRELDVFKQGWVNSHPQCKWIAADLQ